MRRLTEAEARLLTEARWLIEDLQGSAMDAWLPGGAGSCESHTLGMVRARCDVAKEAIFALLSCLWSYGKDQVAESAMFVERDAVEGAEVEPELEGVEDALEPARVGELGLVGAPLEWARRAIRNLERGDRAFGAMGLAPAAAVEVVRSMRGESRIDEEWSRGYAVGYLDGLQRDCSQVARDDPPTVFNVTYREGYDAGLAVSPRDSYPWDGGS